MVTDTGGTKGLWELLDIAGTNSDLGDWGSMFGGMGKFGTGLFEAFQGNKMMGLYEQNMKDQLAFQNKTFNANARQYNNQLARSRNAGADTPDTRQYIGDPARTAVHEGQGYIQPKYG